MTDERHDIELLYRRHAPAVFRRARKLLANDADAHEVVHDLFLSLMERPNQFAGASSVTTFLYSATTHACLNRLRNQRTRRRLLNEHGSLPAAVPSTDGTTLLRSTLANLPPPLAEVAVYHHLDELTHEEIARILGCSRRHVGNLITRLEAATRGEEPSPCR